MMNQHAIGLVVSIDTVIRLPALTSWMRGE